MKLLNTPLLENFKLKHASSRGAIDVWQVHVKKAQWKSPHDVKRDFPSTDQLGENRLIFNIKGNSFRLVVQAKYQNGLILVEWIGTHAEYDKRKF
ncbi:type II toxin-antitoxin system HigB family toxin [Comamonas jiangduensis]|uniref:type II toxin-antitoxin system HigB family toxin n=1 Tax=Comamonas jiangduensis TaxID=1194168 RepID=UPI003BF77992